MGYPAWIALYIGKAKDLASRLRHSCPRLLERYPWERSAIERRLIEEFDPSVNTYLRKSRTLRTEDLCCTPEMRELATELQQHDATSGIFH
jgi:excinuclease UvrABC nuclease subunit